MQRSIERRSLFEECYARYGAKVFHWSMRYSGGRRAWAEDLAHDVFIRLYEKLPELTGEDDLGGWLYRVTANLAISRLRSEKTFGEKVSRLLGGEDDTHVPGPDAATDTREDSAVALRALQALPEKERVVLTMKFLDGQSQRDIAQALGMSEGYVSKLVTRGIERLRAAGWEVGDDDA